MTIPGGFVAGDILGAADMNLLPGAVMGYASVTANQTAIAVEADLTSLTVTWTAVSSRRYRTSFFCNVSAQNSVTTSGKPMTIKITDGSNTQVAAAYAPDPPAISQSLTLVGSVVETGLSGSTTRKLRGLRDADTTANAMTIVASSSAPAYIIVEDIGPA